MEPAVLLFDEPLSNLDAKLRIHMRDEIRKIQQNVGITSIYVTHDQEEAMAISDRVVIMNNGVIEQQGSPRDIYQHPSNEFVATFIGRANILDAKVLKVLDKQVELEIHGVNYLVKTDLELHVNDMVRVVIRPEGVVVDQKDYQVKVEKSSYMGPIHEYGVDFFGLNVEISESNPASKSLYKIGEMMDIGFNPSTIHILKK